MPRFRAVVAAVALLALASAFDRRRPSGQRQLPLADQRRHAAGPRPEAAGAQLRRSPGAAEHERQDDRRSRATTASPTRGCSPTAPCRSISARRPTSSTTTARPTSRCPRRPTRMPRRSGSSSTRRGASSGMTIASTGWVRGCRRRSRTTSKRTKVFAWQVPVQVGTAKGDIAGTLYWVPKPGGSAPMGAIVALLALVVLGGGRGGHRAPPAGSRRRTRGRRSSRCGRDRSRGLVRRAVVTLVLAALAGLALAAPSAQAHAMLEGTSPARGAVLTTQPAGGRVSLRRVGRGQLRRRARLRRQGTARR